MKFSSSPVTIISSLILSIYFSLMYLPNLDFHNIDTPLFLKFLALTTSILYLLLSAGMKRLKVDEDGVEFFYYLRPFARRYRYEYGDVKKVYFESAGTPGSFPLFIFTTKRNHPFLFFKNKYLFFLNKNYYDARDILDLMKEKNLRIRVKGSDGIFEFLNKNSKYTWK